MKLIVIFCLINVAVSDYKFTEEMRSKCKTYKSNNGYSYTQYFKAHSGHRTPGMKFELHLAIQAKNNGHILLSNALSPRMDEPVYEITIGAGGNTFTELRRMRMRHGKSTTDTFNILKEDEFVPFWIKAHDDGLIEFGKEGEEGAIVMYQDPQPLNISYFSFTSWRGIPAVFLYDCPTIDEKYTDVSEEVKKNLTDVERLRKDLFKDYDPSSRPIDNFSTTTSLFLEYNLKSVSFDVKKSVLTSHGKLRARWTDFYLSWEPYDYGNISSQNFHINEIWKPEIKIYGSVDPDFVKWTDSVVSITYDGVLVAYTNLVSKTWCSSSKNVVYWPHDRYSCDIKLGSWSQYSQLNLSASTPMKKLKSLQSLSGEYIPSEWELVSMNLSNSWTYSPFFDIYGSDQNIFNTFDIKISIQRIDHTYKATLYAPFFCIILIIFITFWISTSPTTKITVLCIEILVVMAFAFEVMDSIPIYANHTPDIVLFYFWAMLALSLSIIVNSTIVKLSTNPEPWMCKFREYLTNLNVGTCFLFSNFKMDDGYKSYDADKCEQDEDADGNGNGNGEMEWRMIGTAIDRIIFTVFTVIYGIWCSFK